ncbi:RNA polymerase II C-terminal domain phosphatase-like 2 [Sesamum angolense]|uniref:RNA polymerase II C-terminal domain phosphatase-like 2 n=1 Tax=Sesamum angolense TaxID=2727404 RepID=A0AAE1WN31_9LAMI|nr:RNA polymerase II C-terminal domain phosphatase-like 2 [Sesamum angolense]
MPSKQKKFPCFWCYSVPCGLYNACFVDVEHTRLAIVFDLDETLIVANTMKSFEDRIDALMGWIARETDPIRESGMTAEMKRYIEDRALLKQYADTDCVVDGGKVYKFQQEEVPLLSDGSHRVVRPVVRLPEKNIVLTRINPETANAVPVLCVARNVACNVRGGFFKEFDENLLRRISDIFYEDEVVNLPCAPDVSNYLMSEEETNAPNAVSHPMANNIELKSESSKLPAVSLSSATTPASTRVVLPSEKPSLLGDPFRRDSRYSGSTEPPLLSRLPWQAPILQPQGGWLVEEDTNRGNFISRTPGITPESDPSDRLRGRQNLLSHEIGVSNQSSSNNKELKPEADKMNMLPSLSIGVLQEIGRRCRSKVEFRPVVSTSDDLQFSVEVFFTGERIGVGMGKTRKDAQQQAAENALRSLADNYISYISPHSTAVDNDFDRLLLEKENGFLWDIVKPGSEAPQVNNGLLKQNTSEVGILDNSSMADLIYFLII